MLLGFRAGDDPAIKVRKEDFAGTRRAWNLPAGTAPLARVFPDNPFVNADEDPRQFVKRLARAARPALDAGMIPFPSFKPNVAHTIAGRMDPLFTAVGEWCVQTGCVVHLTVHHEPENDTMGATSDIGRARNFVAVYERAYTVIKAAGGHHVAMGPVHMGYHWRPQSSTTATKGVATAWWVDPAKADFVGIDTYTSNWSLKSGATLEERKDVQRWRKLLNVPDGKLAVVERGITRNPPKHADGAGFQHQVLVADLEYLNRIGAYAFMYWNSGGATDDSVFLLGQSGIELFQEVAVVAAA